jgi:hypothetical protein
MLIGELDREITWEPRGRWKDNIKIGLKETGCEDVDWIHLDQDRVQWLGLVNTILKLQFHERQVIY